MDLTQIKELLKIVAESGVAEVEIEEDDFKLVVRKSAPAVTIQPPAYPMYGYPPPYPAAPMPPAPVPPPAPPPNGSGGAPPQAASPAAPSEAPKTSGKEVLVRAPIVGTFYSAPAPDADQFVAVGAEVKPGDVLCIIEAMKLMNEIECETAGTIRKILVDNAQAVEYDQPLFVIEPA